MLTSRRNHPMLPVRHIESQILEHVARSNRLVLTAPTGSGKSTQVPPMLLQSDAVRGRIVVLQPRRLAARLVARRVAEELNTDLGELVGYQTRHERVVSDASRILFLTEGLFLRQMQGDPTLPGVGAVVLDEFHERSLDVDMALGALRRLQDNGRPDLRLIVMSATLEAQAVADALDCPALEAHGRTYPVDVRYLPGRRPDPVWDLAADAVRDVLQAGEEGHVLVFMPGAYEIRRTIDACRRFVNATQVDLRPLHGSLPPAEQDAAVAPSAKRKIIVATNVAETSITIEGVRHVIDSGLAKVHHYDARRGINVLRTEPISQASADQRTGRAGRTAPGTCVRLWPAAEHRTRPAADTPEVRRLDLAQAVLQLMSMGVADVRTFPWLDPPTDDALQRAESLLRALDAIDERGTLNPRGRRMAAFPVHPRLARMLLEAAERRCLGRATLWAALASERDIVTGRPPEAMRQFDDHESASDLVVRERLMEAAEAARFDARRCTELNVSATTCREVARTRQLFDRLARAMRLPLHDAGDTPELIKCLLAAFADHVALWPDTQRRHAVMPGHKRVVLDDASVVRRPGPVVALDVRELGRGAGATSQTVLALVSEVDPTWLAEMYPDLLRTERVLEWNEQTRTVEQVEQQRFGELVLSSKARPAPPSEAATEVLAERVQRGEVTLEGWNENVEQWIARTRCVAEWFPERDMIRYDDEDLAVILQELLSGATGAKEIERRPVLPALRDALSWDDQQFIERMAPAELRLPSGRRMKLTYTPGQPPVGRAKIQDLYGLDDTPRVAAGRQKVRLEILGPNFRPVQVTDDLAGFWQHLYPQLKRELSRRYPKHEWR